MAALMRKALTQTTLSVNGKHGIQFIRLGSYWNKDWKPGPYPQTQAERAAAAKKYGLLLQDYEPYPDDGMGYGDYPKLPLVSNDQRDPFANWDYPDLKRNFGEPMHVDYDMYVEERMSNAEGLYTRKQMFQAFLVAFGTLFGLLGVFEYSGWVVEHPIVKKQYPGTGKVHYTFEPLD